MNTDAKRPVRICAEPEREREREREREPEPLDSHGAIDSPIGSNVTSCSS